MKTGIMHPVSISPLTSENHQVVFAAVDDCADSTASFEVPGLKKETGKMSSCAAAAKYTDKLCAFPVVQAACPVTCGTCYNGYICSDADIRFFVPSSNKPNKKRAYALAGRTATAKRCSLDSVSEMCPVSCGTCDPNVKPYSFDNSNMSYGTTLGPDDIVPGFYGRYMQDGFYVGALRMITGWISPEMLNVEVNESSRLRLTFDYQLYNVDNDPCPADQELYLCLRLTTGPYDYHGIVATTELVGPITADLGSYSAVFDYTDDIVGLVQEGYAYQVDTIIPGEETDTICTGTYYAQGFTVTTNFAYYDWQAPTPSPTVSRRPTASPYPTNKPAYPYEFGIGTSGLTFNYAPYSIWSTSGVYLAYQLKAANHPMSNVILNELATLELSFTNYRIRGDYVSNPCPDTELYLQLRMVTSSDGMLTSSVATTELVGPITEKYSTYSKTFTFADDIVSKAQDWYTYSADIVIPESSTICYGTDVVFGVDLKSNFAVYFEE